MTARSLHLAKDMTLPLDAVTGKLAWLGRTGSGKTYGAMKRAELMLEAGAQNTEVMRASQELVS